MDCENERMNDNIADTDYSHPEEISDEELDDSFADPDYTQPDETSDEESDDSDSVADPDYIGCKKVSVKAELMKVIYRLFYTCRRPTNMYGQFSLVSKMTSLNAVCEHVPLTQSVY